MDYKKPKPTRSQEDPEAIGVTPEERFQAVQEARAEGHSLVEIAEAIGTSGKNLGAMVRRRASYSPYLTKLDRWLEENRFLGSRRGGVLPASPLGVGFPADAVDATADLLLRIGADAESFNRRVRANPPLLAAYSETEPVDPQDPVAVYALSMRVREFVEARDCPLTAEQGELLSFAAANLLAAVVELADRARGWEGVPGAPQRGLGSEPRDSLESLQRAAKMVRARDTGRQ